MPVQTPLPTKYLKNNETDSAQYRELNGNSWSFHCQSIAVDFLEQRLIAEPFKRRRGFVYFATDGDLIKIGHSITPKQRIASQRSPSGKRLKHLAHFPGFMDEEHSLHRLFQAHATPAIEWFTPNPQIDALVAALQTHRAPLFKYRISITDVVLGRHIAILEMPHMTKELYIPAEGEEFSRWADRECPNWPTDLMVKSAHAAAALKQQYGTDPAHVDRFAEAYRQWAGI